MKKRKPLVLAAVFATAVLVVLLCKKTSPPQIITLPSVLPGSEQFQFVTAEWGMNTIQPSSVARFVSHLPASVSNYVHRKWGKRLDLDARINAGQFSLSNPWLVPPKPSEPSLRVWLRCLSTNPPSMLTNGLSIPNVKFMLADKSGVVAGRSFAWCSNVKGMTEWMMFDFSVVPRRSETLQLLVFDNAGSNGRDRQIGTVSFPNPLHGHFPNWQPESIPATKTAGDVTVRLESFSMKTAPGEYGFGEDKGVEFRLHSWSPNGAKEEWMLWRAELSDATGNHIQRNNFTRLSPTEDYFFGHALWPDESAWRLKLELKRAAGFAPEELVTFRNVPLLEPNTTKSIWRTNSVGGTQVVLEGRLDAFGVNHMNQTKFQLKVPEGFLANVIRVTSETGAELNTSIGNDILGGSEYSPTFQTFYSVGPSLPSNVANVDITWAVQKMRTVEFFVKPPKVEPAIPDNRR